MKEQYYLISQLPAFSMEQGGELPVSWNSFLELCSRFLLAKDFDALSSLSLEPDFYSGKTGYAALDKWNEYEKSLRYVLAGIRAGKLKKEFNMDASGIFPGGISQEVINTAGTAAGFKNPLEAEIYLCEAGARFAESLAGFDIFSLDNVFAYGIRLRLAERIRLFNEEAGIESYKKIYDQILGETK